jgi:hypothetical protein
MKIDCVLTSVNNNKLYYDFIPFFIKSWNKLYPDIDVKIIYIGETIPEIFDKYKNNIILFNNKLCSNISSSFISQYIRILYPSILNYKNGILITDIDMIPMNKSYFTEYIIDYDNTKFIHYRSNVCMNNNEIAICYSVATNKIWSDITKINNLDDIYILLNKKWNDIEYIEGSGNIGWSTDQLDLYNYINKWDNKKIQFIKLNDKITNFKRLDRNTFTLNNMNIINNIKNHYYSDYHCYRPMNKYYKLNYLILDLL